MPADRSLADDHGDEIVSRYQQLRTALILALARRLRAFLDDRPGDEPRTIARRLVAPLQSALPGLAGRAVTGAATAGRDAAERDLREIEREPRRPSRLEVAGRVLDLARTLESSHPRIVSWAEQSYRAVALDASLADGGTRLQVAQRSWSRLVGRGITGYTDAAGRQWELASYVEMATRSRLADTAVTAHLDRLADAALDLVIVSDVAGECRLCRPWEGKVLARTGAGAHDVQVEHATQDRLITVRLAGSVDDARRAGLMHPNCRHTLSAYLPGVTRKPTHTRDPEGDAARQRQRELERQIRAWKLQADAALDPAAAKRFAANARARQALLREHLAAHPELRRRPERERIGTAR